MKKKQPIVLRHSPQISCTVEPEDKQYLDEMVLFCTYKKKQPYTISKTLRTILEFCKRNKRAFEDYV